MKMEALLKRQKTLGEIKQKMVAGVDGGKGTQVIIIPPNYTAAGGVRADQITKALPFVEALMDVTLKAVTDELEKVDNAIAEAELAAERTLEDY